MESQTWVQILLLCRTDSVIFVSKPLITLSLGFLVYKGREQASFIQSLTDVYSAPAGCLVLGFNGDSDPSLENSVQE